MTLQLKTARLFAEKVVAELLPFCDRIEIAGSIRRQRPEVHDVDIVLIPLNAMSLGSIRSLMQEKCEPIKEGDKLLAYTHRETGIQIDLYIAHGEITDLAGIRPSNWGIVLLCRTGSKEHNILLNQKAKSIGMQMKWNIGLLDRNGLIVASETEEQIFKGLGLRYVEPNLREVPKC